DLDAHARSPCGSGPGGYGQDELGYLAADPGFAEQAAAHSGECRRPVSDEQHARSYDGSSVLCPVGLVRWRFAGRMEMRILACWFLGALVVQAAEPHKKVGPL